MFNLPNTHDPPGRVFNIWAEHVYEAPFLSWHNDPVSFTEQRQKVISIDWSDGALAQTARTHTEALVHTKGTWIVLASGKLIILFYGSGWGWWCWGLVLLLCLWYFASVCEIVRKEAAVRSIHPLRRFPAGSDVRVGKWAGPRILCLLWVWHELGPRPLRMWWMYFLIFLSLLTSLWLMAGWFSLWLDETASWFIIIGHNKSLYRTFFFFFYCKQSVRRDILVKVPPICIHIWTSVSDHCLEAWAASSFYFQGYVFVRNRDELWKLVLVRTCFFGWLWSEKFHFF